MHQTLVFFILQISSMKSPFADDAQLFSPHRLSRFLRPWLFPGKGYAASWTAHVGNGTVVLEQVRVPEYKSFHTFNIISAL